jgi:hypothetical protein
MTALADSVAGSCTTGSTVPAIADLGVNAFILFKKN